MSLPPVVRAFLCNAEGNILLTQHKKDTPWVLPGGHVEPWESIHEAILREIREEFDISSSFFDIDTEEILHHKWEKLKHYPLPISIYELNYTNKEWKDASRVEYVFLMQTDESPKNIQVSEIFAYKWFDAEEILSMTPNRDTYDFIIEMLEKIIGNDDDIE